jgi:hypothetical protein
MSSSKGVKEKGNSVSKKGIVKRSLGEGRGQKGTGELK